MRARKPNSLDDRVTTTFREVDIDKLDEPTQDLRFFRDSAFEGFLCDDLRREGAIIPVLVRPKPNTDRFVIVDGVTRVRNERLLGKRTVQCQVVDCDESTAIVLGLKMNIYRRGHDPVGLAKAFKTLHDKFGVKYKDIAERFNYTRSWVSKLVALNHLSPEHKQMVASGDMTIEDGYSIVSGDKHVLEYIDERRKIHCEVCSRPFEALEVSSIRVCIECRYDLDAIHARREKRLKHDMEEAAKRAREGQKLIIDE